VDTKTTSKIEDMSDEELNKSIALAEADGKPDDESLAKLNAMSDQELNDIINLTDPKPVTSDYERGNIPPDDNEVVKKREPLTIDGKTYGDKSVVDKEKQYGSIGPVTPGDAGSDNINKALRGAEEIRPQPPYAQRMLPGAGQFVGNIAGGMAASAIAKNPQAYPIGAAIGGTLGRAAGILTSEEIDLVRKDPARAASELFMPGSILHKRYLDLPEKEKALFQKHLIKTGVIEAIGNVGGAALQNTLQFLGKGVLEGLLGKRIVQQGEEFGWGNILKYSDRMEKGIPQEVAVKAGKFWQKLFKTTGNKTAEAIKANDQSVSLGDIKNQVDMMLPEGITIDSLEASPTQKKLLSDETNKILSLTGAKRKISSLWEIRKDLDKVIGNHSWSQEAMQYINNLRRILNEPIRKGGKNAIEVQQAFDKYAFVASSQDQIGRELFEGVQDRSTGKYYQVKLESYLKNLLSPNKDELIKHLKALDELNNLPDKAVNDFLNYAAAESLDTELGFGPVTKILSGMLRAKRALAGGAKLMQEGIPIVGTNLKLPWSAPRRAVSSGLATVTTDWWSPEGSDIVNSSTPRKASKGTSLKEFVNENFGIPSAEASEPKQEEKDPSVWKSGKASRYGDGEKLNPRTANNEKFDTNKLAAAIYDVPFGTKLLVTNKKNGKYVTVTVNDRGPNKRLKRAIDLTSAAAKKIGLTRKQGLTDVEIKVVGKPKKK